MNNSRSKLHKGQGHVTKQLVRNRAGFFLGRKPDLSESTDYWGFRKKLGYNVGGQKVFFMR